MTCWDADAGSENLQLWPDPFDQGTEVPRCVCETKMKKETELANFHRYRGPFRL